ncbi:MAG: hypothetical protein F9K18_05285 [Thermoanaerobaculia bacterium]|nr:MAG: hypothetical protein F9K18_05285 [Thermoanaerobaculia bacterium]
MILRRVRGHVPLPSGIAALLAALCAPAGFAQVSFNGPQFQVNTYTTSGQRQSAVAGDASGGFVVAWASEGSPGTDPLSSVQARRYDTGGIPLGDQFQVNSYTTNSQYFPAVTVAGQGGFVVVWLSWGSTGTDNDEGSIQGQRFDAIGTPLGGEFQVNGYTTGLQEYPRVASDGLGNFVVVWHSSGSFGDDPAGSVQAQRFGSDGTPLGAQFQVNSFTTENQTYPAVAVDFQGHFVVVWQSFGSSGTDQDNWSIQAQRFDAGGTPLGAEFQVNSYTSDYQGEPAVAADSQGNFVVAWSSVGSFGNDTSGLSIQAQRFAADGTPLGAQFQVNSYTTGDQRYPAVAADSRGGFVVAWQSFGSSGSDNDSLSVQGRRFDSLGNPLGGQFQVNSYTTSSQKRAAVATDALGDFVVVWESNGSSGTDQDGQSIQAQRFDGLFRDGFEAGDTARWSGVVP